MSTDTDAESNDARPEDTTEPRAPADEELPRAFLLEASGEVTRLTERADGITEREPVDVAISRRLETLGAVDRYYAIRDRREWKRAALNHALEALDEEPAVRYCIDDDQLEAWTIQVDARADAYRGLVETLEELAANTGRLERELSNYAESLHRGHTNPDDVVANIAQDCKRSELFGAGAAIAELVQAHSNREDVAGYAEALAERLQDTEGDEVSDR